MVGHNKHEAPIASATVRTRSRIVNFVRPFRLAATDGPQPAGAYTVETDEEMIGSVSFPAYHRTATWIRLPSTVQHAGVPAGLDRVVNVDPTELDAALAHDLAASAEGTAADALQGSDGDEPRVAVVSTPRRAPDLPARGNRRRSGTFTVRDWLDANQSDLTWIALASFWLVVLGFLMRFDMAAH